MEEYYNKIAELIVEKAGLEKEDIEVGSYFEDDLNIGEMELIEIIEGVEEHYKISIIEFKDDVETVQDLIELMTEQLE